MSLINGLVVFVELEKHQFIHSLLPNLFMQQLFTQYFITLSRLTLSLFHILFSWSFIFKANPSPLSIIFKMTMQPCLECNNLKHSLCHPYFYSNLPNVAMNFHYVIYDCVFAHRKTVPAVQQNAKKRQLLDEFLKIQLCSRNVFNYVFPCMPKQY